MHTDLHIVFTLDCPTAGPQAPPYGPAGWGASALAIDSFCTTVLKCGFLPTVFVTPETAEQHAPMLEELMDSGVEIGVLVQPPMLRDAGLKHPLGAYSREEQEAIAGETRRRVEDQVRRRLLSVRSALYSANDHTFEALTSVGFRQASLSSPGRQIAKHHADWAGAATGPHFASRESRLQPGTLPILEVPVTTDPAQRRGGISPELAVENGSVEHWHAPLIRAELERLEAEASPFRVLSFVSTSNWPYADPSKRYGRVLRELGEYLDEIEDRYTIVPATLSSLYAYYRQATDTFTMNGASSG